ncbi:MAG: hypothetical protein K9K32_05410 [Halanaerobiales bacterium]|nr:hypothetical protein [Halanaerobiales bacterium]MCF8009183.1 hypothetical protein [Halanaerobiales bacterium]
MAKIIKGNHDGENGENRTYTIPGRGSNILGKTLAREIEKENKHPNYGVYERNGEKYIRGKADNKKNNNVNN